MSKGEQWSSEWTFILAALGSAVGLGNIWRFPYVAGENGGGAFVLLYLFFVFGLGLPALIATIMVGRRGKLSPIRCFETVTRQEGLSSNWVYLGWLLVLSAFLLLTFFSVEPRTLEWTIELVCQSLAFMGLATVLFRLAVRDAATLMGLTVFAVIGLLLLSVLVQWAASF